MTRSTQHRTNSKIVAVVNLILSIGELIALSVWLYLRLKNEKNLADFFSTKAGATIIGWSALTLVGAVLEASLAVLLFYAIIENSFTKVKIWFLVQTVYLAAITLGFLVDLTAPYLQTLIPIFVVIIIKSLSLWMISKLVDAMKFEAHQARLISPFVPPDGNSFRGDYSPTASQILHN